MTAQQLLGLSLRPLFLIVRRWLLQRKLKTLYRLRDYFVWQVSNGQAGMKDTDKRIVILESDIRNLR